MDAVGRSAVGEGLFQGELATSTIAPTYRMWLQYSVNNLATTPHGTPPGENPSSAIFYVDVLPLVGIALTRAPLPQSQLLKGTRRTLAIA